MLISYFKWYYVLFYICLTQLYKQGWLTTLHKLASWGVREPRYVMAVGDSLSSYRLCKHQDHIGKTGQLPIISAIPQNAGNVGYIPELGYKPVFHDRIVNVFYGEHHAMIACLTFIDQVSSSTSPMAFR